MRWEKCPQTVKQRLTTDMRNKREKCSRPVKPSNIYSYGPKSQLFNEPTTPQSHASLWDLTTPCNHSVPPVSNLTGDLYRATFLLSQPSFPVTSPLFTLKYGWKYFRNVTTAFFLTQLLEKEKRMSVNGPFMPPDFLNEERGMSQVQFRI